MECKFCQHQLEEGSLICPNCGKDNAETAEEVKTEEVKTEEMTVEETTAAESPAEVQTDAAESKTGIMVTPGKLAVAILAGVLVIAALVAAVLYGLGIRINFSKDKEAEPTTSATEPTVPATIPPDGNPDDETCKGTYTVKDEAGKSVRDTVVARVGDAELTNGQLQVYYWFMVQQYLQSGYGPDYSSPLDTQICPLSENGATWQQFLLQSALNEWCYTQSLAQTAANDGYVVPNEVRTFLDEIPATLEKNAVAQNMENGKALLALNVGNMSEIEDYMAYMEAYYQGTTYIDSKFNAYEPTMEEMKEYYTKNEETLIQNGVTKDSIYTDVRHILIMPKKAEGAEADSEFTEAEWETCRKEAQAILDAWKKGDRTEDSFADLAKEKSEDPGSQSNGGLYQNVHVGQMVKPFEEWCFDTARKYGDTGLVKTSYGYHVMYFVGSTPVWEVTVKNAIRNEYASGLIADANAAYTMTVDYSAIVLSHVDMSKWFS